MSDNNLLLTSQFLQAILVGSSALAGFAGILVIEFARLVRKADSWVKWLIGLITGLCGIAFIFCVNNIVNWFEYQGMFTSNLDSARTWFYVQSFSFLILFLIYIFGSFFSKE